MYRLICAVVLLVSLCTNASGHKANDLIITPERTACFGTCPVYKLTIRGDGSVVYEGKKFVRVVGTRERRIDKAAVADLVKAFLDAEYFGMKDEYESIQNPDGTFSMVTDPPTTYTSLTLNGRHKQIADYVGAPKQLKSLERKVDEVAGSKRWLTIDAEAVHDEVDHGWDVNGREAQRMLQEAAERGDAEVIKAFVTEGADVNAPIGNLTPLQRARGVEAVRALVSAGADVNTASKKYFGPPLVFGAELGDAESIRVLLQAGAKVDGRSPDGETPLLEAASSGNPAAVEALLLAGADVNAKDNSGEDAPKYAAHGLERQVGLAKQPDPFEEPIPDYSSRYKQITDMLVAARAMNEPSTK